MWAVTTRLQPFDLKFKSMNKLEYQKWFNSTRNSHCNPFIVNQPNPNHSNKTDTDEEK